MTIAVDFDGVIHAYSKGWQDGSIYDPPMRGSIGGLHHLLQQDAVFVFTTREPEQVVPWLERYGFEATSDDSCLPCHGSGGGQLTEPNGEPLSPPWECKACKGSGLITFWNRRYVLLVTNRKLAAVAYIDDRAIRFENWGQALADLAATEG